MARLASISKAGFVPIPSVLLPAVGAAVVLDWGAKNKNLGRVEHGVNCLSCPNRTRTVVLESPQVCKVKIHDISFVLPVPLSGRRTLLAASVASEARA